MKTTDTFTITFSYMLDGKPLIEALFGPLGVLWAQSKIIDPHWYLHGESI